MAVDEFEEMYSPKTIDGYIDALVRLWFEFMECNEIALDPYANTHDRVAYAKQAEFLMAKRYKMIKKIDKHFEQGLVYNV